MAANSPLSAFGPYRERRLRNKTMRLALVDGCFSTIMIGLQMSFCIPYLNVLGATKFQVGMGASLQALTTGLVQILSPYILHKSGSYKKFVVTNVFLNGLCFIPLALVFYVLPENPVWPAIILLCIISVPLGLSMPAWIDWMSHIVPRKRRGKYFAKRNRISTSIQLLITIAAGFILDTATGKIVLVFSGIWITAAIARVCAGTIIAFYHEPAIIKKPSKPDGNLIRFVKGLKSTMFGRFTLAVSLLHFGTYFAVPFFPIHMLNNLKFTYLQYSLMQVLPTLAAIFFVSFWGKISDRLGYVLPMRLCALTICSAPLLWVITSNYYLLMLNQIIAGIVWAGFVLTSLNYSMSSVDSKNRLSSLAYLNAMTFFFLFAGATIGGIIVEYLPKIGDYRLQTLFLISALIRLSCLLPFVTLKDTERHGTATGQIEKFFFEPRISWRAAVSRVVARNIRRLL